MDEISPLEALLAKSDPFTTTVLDKKLKKIQHKNAKTSQQKVSTKKSDDQLNINEPDHVIVRDRDPNDSTSNITLEFRQPSYTSLSDVIIAKDGTILDGSTGNLESIQENINADLNQTDLSDPQLGLGVRQPSYVSLGPYDVSPRTNSTSDFQINDQEVPKIRSNSIENNSETKLLQELQAKNLKRWKEIGYDPPEDLLPIVRAPINDISTEQQMTLDDQYTQVESSTAKDNMGFDPGNTKIRLLGNLSELDEVFLPPVILEILSSGQISTEINLELVRPKLKAVADKCSENLWIDETEYVNNILTRLDQSTKGSKEKYRSAFYIENPFEAITNLEEKLKTADSEANEKIIDLEARKNQILEDINKEYMQAANELDEKYQDPATLSKFARPSKDLLELREKTKKLLRKNSIAEAKTVMNQLQQRQIIEQNKINQKITEKYFDEDKKLKEKYATCRKYILERFDYSVSIILKERDETKSRIEKRISNIKKEIAEQESIRKFNQSRNSTKKMTKANNRNTKSKIKVGTLNLVPPEKMKRDDDIAKICQMADDILLTDQNPK